MKEYEGRIAIGALGGLAISPSEALGEVGAAFGGPYLPQVIAHSIQGRTSTVAAICHIPQESSSPPNATSSA